MSLNRKLEALSEAMWRNAGPEGAALRAKALANQSLYTFEGKPKKAVAVLPDAGLINADGEPVNLYTAIGARPAVIAFFRGSWCPYSTTAMRAIQSIADDLHKMGVALIGITPQRHITLEAAIWRNGLNWQLFTVPGVDLVDSLGIGVRIIPEMIELYRSQGFDLETLNETHSWILPLEATYIVDEQKRIVEAASWPYPSRRMEPADILAAARRLSPVARAVPA